MNNQSLLQIQPLHSGDVISVGVSSRLIYEGSPCDAFPCWNAGSCIELRRKRGKTLDKGGEEEGSKGRARYICKCSKFFTGPHCEQKLIICPPGTFCWPEFLTAKCIPAATTEDRRNDVVFKECPLACQNDGVCLRLGTAPGHFECLCPSNFAGPLCQFSTSAPLLPGLILLSLFLFLLALLLLVCHGPASAGFLLQMASGGRRGGRRDSRKWPLLEWTKADEEEMFEAGTSLEMRECHPMVPDARRSPSSSSSSTTLFSLKNAIQMPTRKDPFGCSTSKVVHI